jgi:hypothetical protein
LRIALLGTLGLLLAPPMAVLVSSRRRWIVFPAFVLPISLPLTLTFARRRRVLPSSCCPRALIVFLPRPIVIVGGRWWSAPALALMLVRFVLVVIVLTPAAVFSRRRRRRRARGMSWMIVRHGAHQSALHASIVAPNVVAALLLALAFALLVSLLALEVQFAVIRRNPSTATASTCIFPVIDA